MIILLGILIVVAAFFQFRAMRNALKGIGYSTLCSKLLVEPDEPLEMVTTISNTSRRFVPFIKLDEVLPRGTTVLDETIRTTIDIKENIRRMSSAYMMPRSKLERRLPISLPRRGRYLFRGAELSGGDFLGWNDEKRSFFALNEVVVYPKAAPVDNLDSVLGGFLGDVSVRRFIMEDPVLTVGAREYTGREPLKQISWTHSAKTARMMVKQFDYTVEPVVSVMLDVNTKKHLEEKEQLIENCFSLARSVCQLLEKKGIAYDFITNSTTGNALSSWSYMGEGLGRGHLFSILEGLGRATYDCIESFGTTIEKMKRHREGNRSVIIITSERDGNKHQAAHRLRELTGGSVTFIYGEDIDDIYSGS
ncbi:MAG: DUF58 domain-containing protein [Oscillospiraceae bacterium]|nr:DUF58 domain-containing protein [Oscillospiraceae bacterium]